MRMGYICSELKRRTMENLKMSNKIKELRTRGGFSQEQLAEISGLSLRTIQRVEKGESVPRGDTLSRLAKALQSSPDEIIDWQMAKNNSRLPMRESLRKYFDDWKKPVFSYFISIGLFLICSLFNSTILLKIGVVLFLIGFLNLSYSLLYQFSKKRWRSGLLILSIWVLSLIGFTAINTFNAKPTTSNQFHQAERIK